LRVTADQIKAVTDPNLNLAKQNTYSSHFNRDPKQQADVKKFTDSEIGVAQRTFYSNKVESVESNLQFASGSGHMHPFSSHPIQPLPNGGDTKCFSENKKDDVI